jgi:ABC-type molybdate transport system substrate-binding protein
MVAAVSLNAKEPEAAKSFLTFLTSADAASILTKSGLDPMQ